MLGHRQGHRDICNIPNRIKPNKRIWAREDGSLSASAGWFAPESTALSRRCLSSEICAAKPIPRATKTRTPTRQERENKEVEEEEEEEEEEKKKDLNVVEQKDGKDSAR